MACILVQAGVDARDYVKLQAKEMKHAQKYSTTKKFLNQNPTKTNPGFVNSVLSFQLKDPKLLKFYDYEKVDNKAFEEKLKKDEIEYKKNAKNLGKVTLTNYNAQAIGDDYYRIYRIAEKIIRANNLDYINWRIGVQRESEAVNAYSTQTNYICLYTSTLDTFKGNDDALALIIGHEMGHVLLGHQQRSEKQLRKIEAFNTSPTGTVVDSAVALTSAVLTRRYLIESKNQEYAADVEGAKLILKAGFDLNNAEEVLRFFETQRVQKFDYAKEHPNSDKRIVNLHQNQKMFPKEEWIEYGKYNIYNSDVLNVSQSSDRKTIIIERNPKRNTDNVYMPETPEQVYLRSAYMSYLNGQFKKSVEYFDSYIDMNSNNPYAYLYASYAAECLYKNTNDSNYLKKAKEYVQKASTLLPNDKYINEQMDSL